MNIRNFKIIIMASFALLFTLIAVNNISDYCTNFRLVKTVLSMDSIEDANVKWRAIISPPFQHAAYIGIIVWEVCTAAVCLAGAYELFKGKGRAIRVAAIGLMMGFALFMIGFVVVAGEWFYLWASIAASMHAKAILFSLLLGSSACFVILAPEKA